VTQTASETVTETPEKAQRVSQIVSEELQGLRRRLELFPEKSRRIEPKFHRLETLTSRGVIPYTVWDFRYRDDYGGSKDFHGNCSPQVVEQCIWRLTEEGDLVLDPMAGSGTSLDVCRKFNRKCVGYDIKPPTDRNDIVQNDSRKIPLDKTSVDMVFIHPPYWNLATYTDAEEKLPDLSRAKTSEEFLKMLKPVFEECFRVLKKGKFMCILLGDLIREGKFVPLTRKAANLAEEIGFVDYGYALKLAHGEVSRKKSGVIVAEPVYTDNLKISHDLVMFFRKS
jgi:DNA modification methylase